MTWKTAEKGRSWWGSELEVHWALCEGIRLDREVWLPHLWGTRQCQTSQLQRQHWSRLISAGNTTETNLGAAASQVPSRTNNFRGGEIAWQIQLEMSLRGKEAVKTDD